jgi:hypothetical protein
MIEAARYNQRAWVCRASFEIAQAQPVLLRTADCGDRHARRRMDRRSVIDSATPS